MSVNPDGNPYDPSSPTRAREQNVPFLDLNATNIPDFFLPILPHILPVLASLVAQGPDKPRLLISDTLSRLATVNALNPQDRVQRTQNPNDSVLLVGNSELFSVGSWIGIYPGGGSLQAQFAQITGKTASNPNELQISPALYSGANVGDIVLGIGVTASEPALSLALGGSPLICNFSTRGAVGQQVIENKQIPITGDLAAIELVYLSANVNSTINVISEPSGTIIWSNNDGRNVVEYAVVTADQFHQGDTFLNIGTNASGAASLAQVQAKAVSGIREVRNDDRWPLTTTQRDREPDFQVNSVSTSGTVACSVTVTPPAGRRVLISRAYFDQAAPGGASAAVNVASISGPTSGTLESGLMGTTATAGSNDHCTMGPCMGAVGEALTMKSNGPGTAWTGVKASGWYV